MYEDYEMFKKHNKVQGKKVVNMFGNTQFRRDKQMRVK